jgi:hypothetical protein
MLQEHPRFHAETKNKYFCLLNSAEFELTLRSFDNGILRIEATRIFEKRENLPADDNLCSENNAPQNLSCLAR